MPKHTLLLCAAILASYGCERKPATVGPPAPPAPTAHPPATDRPAPAVPSKGDVAVGDLIHIVFEKWGKPEVFKLSLEGDAQIFEFSQMPPGINPEAELTFYYLPRNKALLFKFNGTTEEVTGITDIPVSELDLVQATANRGRPSTLPAPSLNSSPQGGGS